MNNQKTDNNFLYFILLTVNLFLALAFRLQHLFTERLWPDEALYAWISQRIFHNPLLIFSPETNSFHPPLFSSILACGYFFLENEIACRFIILILNILGVFFIYRLGKKIDSSFTGVLASVFLAGNYFYFSQSNLILIDGSLVLFYILSALVILSADFQKDKILDVKIAAVCVFMTLLKWYNGILFLPIVGACYLTGPQTLKKKFLRLTVTLLPALTILAALLINQKQSLGIVLKGHHFSAPFWYYFQSFPVLIGFSFLLPFFILGFLELKKKDFLTGVLLFVWLLSFFVTLSVISEKTPRYILPCLPAAFIICALGIKYLINLVTTNGFFRRILRISAILACLGTTVMLYSNTGPGLKRGALGYTGFSEAGRWISRHAGKDTLVIAGSRRAVRYCSGINYSEFGGQIIETPQDRKVFEKIVADAKGAVILEVDKWEYTQASWIYPMTEESAKNLTALGFHLKKQVFRRTSAQRISPVIWIFIKEKN